jgi:DNA polymerase III delta prime subunit
MFFIDKYIPNNINNIFFHKDSYNFLKLISTDESIPHLIFYGMDGVGKKTMVRLFLTQLFGEAVNDIKQLKYIVFGSGNKVNEEYFMGSNYHIEISPKGNNNDRYLIQDVIKKYASNTNYNVFESKHKFKIIIIHNIHNMLSSVQFSLRRTIEKYSDTCRFILLTNSIGKIIKPLISRCKCIKLNYPNKTEILKYSLNIAEKENIQISLGKLSYIVYDSKNLKDVLWHLQILKNNDLYLEFIKIKFAELDLEVNKLFQISIQNFLNMEYQKLFDDVHNLYFLNKNINRYINYLGNCIYDHISNKFKLIVDKNNYEKYFINCKTFLNNYNKKNKEEIKKIFLNQNNKKIKFDEIIFEFKTIILKIFSIIRLFELKTDKNIVINKLIKLLLTGNCDNFDEIRDIFFNLIITNFTGTEILSEILVKLIQSKNISDKAKVNILKIFSEGEFNMIKGRREINQYDMIIVNLFDILRKDKNKY